MDYQKVIECAKARRTDKLQKYIEDNMSLPYIDIEPPKKEEVKLFDSIERGDVKALELLVQNENIDFNCKRAYEYERGLTEIVEGSGRWLYERPIDVAFKRGSREVFEALIKNKNLYIDDELMKKVLSKEEYSPVLEKLLAEGKFDGRGEQLLLEAIEQKNKRAEEVIFNNHRLLMGNVDELFYKYSKERNYEKLKMLLNRRDVKIKGGEIAIRELVKNGNAEFIEFVIKKDNVSFGENSKELFSALIKEGMVSQATTLVNKIDLKNGDIFNFNGSINEVYKEMKLGRIDEKEFSALASSLIDKDNKPSCEAIMTVIKYGDKEAKDKLALNSNTIKQAVKMNNNEILTFCMENEGFDNQSLCGDVFEEALFSGAFDCIETILSSDIESVDEEGAIRGIDRFFKKLDEKKKESSDSQPEKVVEVIENKDISSDSKDENNDNKNETIKPYEEKEEDKFVEVMLKHTEKFSALVLHKLFDCCLCRELFDSALKILSCEKIDPIETFGKHYLSAVACGELENHSVSEGIMGKIIELGAINLAEQGKTIIERCNKLGFGEDFIENIKSREDFLFQIDLKENSINNEDF